MVHTVGITGVRGNVGVPTSKFLHKAAEEGKIKLVVFHRPSSKPAGLEGKNVEFRPLDYNSDAPAAIEKVVQGINTFVSAAGIESLKDEPKIADALAKSPDLVTFVPSMYSTTWTEEDHKDPVLGPMMQMAHGGWARAEELNIPTTIVYCGVFENLFFEGFLDCPIKENVVWANEAQMQKGVPITNLEHLGKAIADAAIADPASVKNKSYSAVSFWPTGKELAELYTKLHGKPTQVKDYSASDRETMRNDQANIGMVKVGYRDRWASGDWGYESGGKIPYKSYDGPSLEEAARTYL